MFFKRVRRLVVVFGWVSRWLALIDGNRRYRTSAGVCPAVVAGLWSGWELWPSCCGIYARMCVSASCGSHCLTQHTHSSSSAYHHHHQQWQPPPPSWCRRQNNALFLLGAVSWFRRPGSRATSANHEWFLSYDVSLAVSSESVLFFLRFIYDSS